MDKFIDSLPERHALKRAYNFLNLAEQSKLGQREEFESFIESAIIFARSALHRLISNHRNVPNWKQWFDLYKDNESVNFFKNHRDFILKEGSAQIGQIIGFDEKVLAKDIYYFDIPTIPATETVRLHLKKIAEIEKESITLF